MQKLSTLITQTPFRISFLGGGTDFPEFFNESPGYVLGATIKKYLYVTINSLERLLEKKIRFSYSKLEMVDRPEELSHDLAREALKKHASIFNGGFLDFHSFADLPYNSGVGSSSAFIVGFLNALYLLHGLYKSPKEIAKEAIEIERYVVKSRGGWQDQIHAACGGFNIISFANNDFTVTPICVSQEKIKCLEDNSLLFFTGLIRESKDVQEKVFDHPKAQSQFDLSARRQYLVQLSDLVHEGADILINSTNDNEGMLKDFGNLLDRSWRLKKQLSDSISNSMIEEIYDVAMKSGAHGGKLLGAGGGGFLLFVVPSDKRENVIQALSAFKHIQVQFEPSGSRVIFARQ